MLPGTVVLVAIGEGIGATVTLGLGLGERRGLGVGLAVCVACAAVGVGEDNETGPTGFAVTSATARETNLSATGVLNASGLGGVVAGGFGFGVREANVCDVMAEVVSGIGFSVLLPT